MRVNCKKSQLLVVSPKNCCISGVTVGAPDNPITTVNNIRLLDLMLNSSGNMDDQVRFLKTKFRAKFWSLIHLNGEITGKDLYTIDCVCAQPVLKTNGVIFHSMITRAQCKAIEHMQSLVLKLCFGFHRGQNGISKAP